MEEGMRRLVAVMTMVLLVGCLGSASDSSGSSGSLGTAADDRIVTSRMPCSVVSATGISVRARYESDEEGHPVRAVHGHGSSDILLECSSPTESRSARIERGEPGYGGTPVRDASPKVLRVIVDWKDSTATLACALRQPNRTDAVFYSFRLPELALRECRPVACPAGFFLQDATAGPSGRYVLWCRDDKAARRVTILPARGEARESALIELTGEEGALVVEGDKLLVKTTAGQASVDLANWP
jgi:hypothetical protein